MCSKQLKLYVEVAEKQNAHKIVIELEIKKLRVGRLIA